MVPTKIGLEASKYAGEVREAGDSDPVVAKRQMEVPR